MLLIARIMILCLSQNVLFLSIWIVIKYLSLEFVLSVLLMSLCFLGNYIRSESNKTCLRRLIPNWSRQLLKYDTVISIQMQDKIISIQLRLESKNCKN